MVIFTRKRSFTLTKVFITPPSFCLRVKEADILQSMSRKENCWDNASMEPFFGHLKDELEYEDRATPRRTSGLCTKYIDYYNSERGQWTLKKMTPD